MNQENNVKEVFTIQHKIVNQLLVCINSLNNNYPIQGKEQEQLGGHKDLLADKNYFSKTTHHPKSKQVVCTKKNKDHNYSAALKIVSRDRKRLMISKYKETEAQINSSYEYLLIKLSVSYRM